MADGSNCRSVPVLLPGRARWTDEVIELVRKMFVDEGKSAGDIAAFLGQGTTRNMIMGVLFRNQIQRMPAKGPESAPRSNRSRPSPPPPLKPIAKLPPPPTAEDEEEEVVPVKKPAAVIPPPPPPPPAVAKPRKPGAVTIYDLTLTTCRWPMWSDQERLTPSQQFYCGEPCGVSDTYCKKHGTRAYPSAAEKERAAAQRAVRKLEEKHVGMKRVLA
jgi:hypothetical protein